jgi:hypothetical protein
LGEVSSAGDAVTLPKHIAIADVGAGTNAVLALATIVAADIGYAEEAVTSLVYVSAEDTVVGFDALAILLGIAVSDSALGAQLLDISREIGLFKRLGQLGDRAGTLYDIADPALDNLAGNLVSRQAGGMDDRASR